MTDTNVMEALRVMLLGLDEFANGSVVIDDWSILDGSSAASPFIIIETPDSFVSRQDNRNPTTTWDIPVTLLVAFDDWQPTLAKFRTTRNAIIEKMNGFTGERSTGAAASPMSRYNPGAGGGGHRGLCR